MRGLQKLSVTLSIIIGAYCGFAQASYTDESEFGTSGSIASTLENSIDTFLMPFEVQQVGNSVYNVGINYGPSGQQNTTSTPQVDFVTQHASVYCSPNISVEKTGFSCNGQAGNLNNDTTSAQLLEMGDIRTSVLLEPTMYTQSIYYAAQNFIRNITMPFPVSTYANYISNPAMFNKNTSQMKNYANNMAAQALLGVARYAMDEMYGMRVNGSEMGLGNNQAVASQSIMSMMQNEATRRFQDPNYVTFITGQSTTANQLLADMAAMHAFSLWMDYQSYRQNERIAALLAAILSNNVNTNIATQNQMINAGVNTQ